MKVEVRYHLCRDIIPFWKALRDDEFGGYYGFMDYDLNVDKKYIKGCILNSRITWFFSNAYTLLKDESLLEEAKHGYEFLKDHCLDKENGGIYWAMNYDGSVNDSMKHTYNQGFAIYALSSYYEASGDKEALKTAKDIFNTIESKCKDEVGYLEAFDKEFNPVSNEALSENGVMADRTMNTLLHIVEGYTELYRVSGDPEVKEKLHEILHTFSTKIYNPDLHRQEVFFDSEYNSIIDLYSYGHDIETSWLIDRTVDVLNEKEYTDLIYPITQDLAEAIYNVAFDGSSLPAEAENGVVKEARVWWVQAETLLGFLNAYRKNPEEQKYLEAANAVWQNISKNVIDKRSGEWFSELDKEGKPNSSMPMVEPWKCPYHNGRMCFEILKSNLLD